MMNSWMSSWWLLWMVFIFVFLVSPVGYGWGYRSWGPPYPRYVQRRRALRSSTTGSSPTSGGSPTFNHEAWGWRGDFVWMVILLGVVWAAWVLWWV